MANYQDPSTDVAKFKAGVNDGSYRRADDPNGERYYKDGSLGAGERLTKNPEMSYKPNSRQAGLAMGLPEKIYGNPLGCSCRVANLNGVSSVVNGEVEADYRCGVNWHNYVVFEVRQNASSGEVGLKVDKFGNLIETEGFQTGELEEY